MPPTTPKPAALSRGLLRRVTAALGLGVCLVQPDAARAQAAVDPNVAPRAAALERQGERRLAVDLLGRYLAVATHDGGAWFQLGRLYLLDARDWHTRGHIGQPDASLFLDFSATALDQAGRLYVDSAVVFRGLVDVERALLRVEADGWTAEGIYPLDAVALPPFIVELGANLLGSCPTGGVILSGDDLETLAVWYARFGEGRRPDLLPLRPRLYATDSVYRRVMARALEVDETLAIQQALAHVNQRRPVCITPFADSGALPADVQWTPVRLVLVSRTDAEPTGDIIAVTEYVDAQRRLGSHWLPDVRAIYTAAARRNPLLCRGLMAQLGEAAAGCR